MHACSSKDHILDHQLPAHEEDGSSRASDINIDILNILPCMHVLVMFIYTAKYFERFEETCTVALDLDVLALM